MYSDESGLFNALSEILKGAQEPLTCVQIYDDNSKIRDLARSPNRVSDYLGNLWRKGLVTRSPAPRLGGSAARWAYSWKQNGKNGKDERAQSFIDSLKTDEAVFQKPGIEIFDHGKSVVINLPEFTITIRQK